MPKSAVREAWDQLRDEALVTFEPQKGTRAFSLSDNEVIQICDFRQAMETAAFEIALKCNPVALAKDMKYIVRQMNNAQPTGKMSKILGSRYCIP